MSEENENKDEEQNLEDEWASALGEQAEASDAEQTDGQDDIDALLKENQAGSEAKATPPAATAAFDEFEEGQELSVGDRSLDMVLDIPVTIAMEIGRTEIPIRNLLQLSQGSVVELDHLAGEPMDVLVNGTLIAHGEVVVVNERYGIRLTDVISPQERVRKLR